mmetsp:Transcript_8298/g.8456  ORF Transcript_8298/g.8456 Transcript_8298/m.8456 type:complete len:518 (-) Transcript_8298:108-1661(-)
MGKPGRVKGVLNLETVILITVLICASLFVGYTALHLITKQSHHSISMPHVSHNHLSNIGHHHKRRVAPRSHHLPSSIPDLNEVSHNMTKFINTLHFRLSKIAGPEVESEAIWNTYLELSKRTLLKWEMENKLRQHIIRQDGSIFVSIASFRDPLCLMTMQSLYGTAKYTDSIYTVIIQQNCFEESCPGTETDSPTIRQPQEIYKQEKSDIDCYKEFCESYEGKKSNACHTGQVQVLSINESEALGPYMGRYFGAKFYRGEQYYLQLDSHSEFVDHWDEKLVHMLRTAPADKPIISSYPPGPQEQWMNSIGLRMCDSSFAEYDILRISPATTYDKRVFSRPRPAPFIAAGFMFTPAQFLVDVPFDPLLPWIFMGEEILISARAWTQGYTIFSPNINVLNHYYVRANSPKYWESVRRALKKDSIFEELNELVLWRVKHILQYPELRDQKKMDTLPRSVKYGIYNYSTGTVRPLSEYLKIVGIHLENKSTVPNKWCHDGYWSKAAKKYKLLRIKKKKNLI